MAIYKGAWLAMNEEAWQTGNGHARAMQMGGCGVTQLKLGLAYIFLVL